MTKSKILALAALVVFTQSAATFAAGASGDKAGADSVAAPGVAAQVDGEPILQADVNRMVDAVREQDSSLQGDSPEVKEALHTVRERILSNLIERRLLVQEAQRRAIQPKPEEVDKAVAMVRGPDISDADYVKALAAEGKTVADVRRFVTEELQVRELAARVTANLTLASITDAQAQAFYDAHPEQWVIPATASAHHVVLVVKPGSTDEQKAEVRNRALSIKKKAMQTGTNFEALARQFSDEPAAKTTGGKLGEFVHDQIAKPIADAVWAANPGDIIGSVESQIGYHIIRVDSRTPAGVVTIDKIQGEIKAFLLKKAFQEKLDQQVQALKSAAKIKEYS